MSSPHACPDCLRRSWLLALLAPYIERIVRHPPNALSLSLLELSDQTLAAAAAPQTAEQILARVDAIPESRFLEELEEGNCWACCRHDGLYPEQLTHDSSAPPALIGCGDASLLSRLDLDTTVAIVGARRATSYGRETSRRLGEELAEAGINVVSGLAFGIDGCAHRGAIDHDGLAVAVLPCGPDQAFPGAHRSLWRRITERGLVISELPPGTPPWRWTCFARTRTVAALAKMTIVVEAAPNSRSLIAVEQAQRFGGRAVGAVPGPVTSRASAAPNSLLRGGARVVRNATDILTDLDRIDGAS
jgi:DNA processing protein